MEPSVRTGSYVLGGASRRLTQPWTPPQQSWNNTHNIRVARQRPLTRLAAVSSTSWSKELRKSKGTFDLRFDVSSQGILTTICQSQASNRYQVTRPRMSVPVTQQRLALAASFLQLPFIFICRLVPICQHLLDPPQVVCVCVCG